MLNVITENKKETKMKKLKRVAKKLLGGNRCAYYLDSGDDIMGVCICPVSKRIH